MKRDMKIEYRKLAVSTLKIHPRVQRPLRLDHAKSIAKNWHPIAFNALTVVQMTSGDRGHYVIDGQHTLTAAKMIGLQMIDCKIVSANSRAEMNEIFQIINSGVMRVSALDSFVLNAENDSRTPDAIASQILNQCNLSIGENGAGTGTHTIRCARAVRESFDRLGRDKFGIVAAFLEIIADGGNPIDTATVKAITEVVRKYGDSTEWIADIAETLERDFARIKSDAKRQCINTSLSAKFGHLVDGVIDSARGAVA